MVIYNLLDATSHMMAGTQSVGSYVSSALWAAWYITRLLIKFTQKGIVFSFRFFPHSSANHQEAAALPPREGQLPLMRRPQHVV